MPDTPLGDIDVVILAGGQGTRLKSLFPDRPKVLVPINGVPFLRHYLNWLRGFGARRVILSLGHMAGMVQDYVRSETWPGMEIETFVETSPLGTGGAVRAVMPLVRSETVLVANGDSLVRADLGGFVAFHRRKRARLSMLLARVDQVGQSGLVETDAGEAVVSFVEKPADRAVGGHINAGLYLMQREAVAEIPGEGPVSIERDVFPRFCGRGFFALKGGFSFIDIGTPDSYRRASEFFRGQTL
ncbi:MAG: NTP transferase domain-containing protein [Verrucomicrobia bacterium]|nr:NTP transferase domain-containing protein [Verrucomicrobiota bacterium]